MMKTTRKYTRPMSLVLGSAALGAVAAIATLTLPTVDDMDDEPWPS